MTTLGFILPLGMIGPTQIVLIVLLIVVLFGGRKIPELMRGMGRGVKEFKDAVNKDYSADDMLSTDEKVKSETKKDDATK